MKLSKAQLRKLISEATTGMMAGPGFQSTGYAPPVDEALRDGVLSAIAELEGVVAGNITDEDLDYTESVLVDLLNYLVKY